MKIFVLLFTLFSFLAFSDCLSSPKVLIDDYKSASTTPEGSAQASTYPKWSCNLSNAYYYYLPGDGYMYGSTKSLYIHVRVYNIVSECPVGQIKNVDGVCVPPEPCSWATTPPWFQIPNTNVVQCNVISLNGISADNTPNYLSNAQYCTSEQMCYGKSLPCPTGKLYSRSQQKCVSPTPDPEECPSGFYSRNYSTGIDDITKSCFTEKICKNNPSIRQTYKVSCGNSNPDNYKPYNTPDGSVHDNPPPPPQNNNDRSAACGTERMMAVASCVAPKILSFKCDPLTGNAVSSCNDPTTVSNTPINPTDSSSASTTADIKTLSNELPSKIKDALRDYFMDGASPLLSTIKGTLDSSNTLQANANDKLDSISASADAQLLLQSDTNSKLDSVKSSVDNLDNTLKDGGTYNGSSMPSNSDLEPDSSLTDGFDVFKNSFDQISNQFNLAQNVFAQGVPKLTFSSGGCPNLSFMSISVSLSNIGNSIAPYSPITSILIYIGLMFNAFRLVFSFFIKGV